jgi:phage terminase large subunit-like protein
MSSLNFSLLPWQQEVLNSKKRFKVVCAGRRCGKSRLSAVMILIKALQAPHGSGVLYVSPTQAMSRVIIWKLLLDIGRDVIASSHINNMEITTITGSVIYVRGADNPDTLRGASLYFAVLDEMADIKPGTWEEVIRASLSDHKGDALIIGTPKGRNHFYDMFQMGQEEIDPDWQSWHFTTADNPLIDPHEIESARRTMSTFAFKSEFMASFDNAGANIFKEEWLKYGDCPKQYSTYIAVDCAGFEEVMEGKKSRLDETAIAVVKVSDDGKWFVDKIEHGRWAIRETAVRILKNIRDYKPLMIGIERGVTFNAVMPYISDLMRKNNIYAHIEQLTHGNQSKNDRVIWALSGLFEHGRVVLNKERNWDSFVDQYMMFPSKNVKDDEIDVLSMISQMAVTTYRTDEIDEPDQEYQDSVDIVCGF